MRTTTLLLLWLLLLLFLTFIWTYKQTEARLIYSVDEYDAKQLNKLRENTDHLHNKVQQYNRNKHKWRTRNSQVMI